VSLGAKLASSATYGSRLSGDGGVVVTSKVESVSNPVGRVVSLGSARQRREESTLESNVDRVLNSAEELVSGSPRVDGDIGEGVNSSVTRDRKNSADKEAACAILGVGLVVARLELDRGLARATRRKAGQ
jgi:hypothetical protein